MAKRRRKQKIEKSSLVVLGLLLIIFIIGFTYHYINYHGEQNFWGFIGDIKQEENDPQPLVTSELSIHFLELGNKYNGDAIYIKAGNNDILIDAGSRKESSTAIKNYLSDYVQDNKLEYVIATHAHQDHIAGFVGTKTHPGIFDLYETETIIDFSKTNSTTELYSDYQAKREQEINAGANHYTALDCYYETNGGKRTYELTPGVTMTILYNYYYDHKATSENDYSVCLLFTQGNNHYLFTGDLEATGEKKLIANNNLPEVTLFKAPHHGSATSSSKELLAVIKPKTVVVCCNCGYNEYNAKDENIFPSQDFVTNTGKWTDEIYVTSITSNNSAGFTSLNGTVIFTSNGVNSEILCTNNNTLFKDTTWCKDNRIWPSE